MICWCSFASCYIMIKLLIQLSLLYLRNNNRRYIKGTLSPHKNFSYMKHMDPLSTKNPSKNSSEFLTPLKNALKVQFSVLNQAKNTSMAPHYHPRMCQWLQNFILIGVNGSKISSLSASMAPDFHPYWRQWLQLVVN